MQSGHDGKHPPCTWRLRHKHSSHQSMGIYQGKEILEDAPSYEVIWGRWPHQESRSGQELVPGIHLSLVSRYHLTLISRYHPVSNGVSLRNSANHKMNAAKDLSNFLIQQHGMNWSHWPGAVAVSINFCPNWVVSDGAAFCLGGDCKLLHKTA